MGRSLVKLVGSRVADTRVWLKMESMQTTGSFKCRGATVQFGEVQKHLKPGQGLICFSGGNYGKAFAFMAGKSGLAGTVLMPETVPGDRKGILEGLGAKVELHPYTSIPGLCRERSAKEGLQYLDPFDDINLVRAYGAVGLELLEDAGVPDVVLVCCGGGGLLSGVAAAVRLSGHSETQIFGVEPETANTMSLSFEQDRVAELPTAHSIATGLVPIRSGDVTYPLAKRFTNGIIQVTDKDILGATKAAAEWGLIIEPSGTAGLAALLAGLLLFHCYA